MPAANDPIDGKDLPATRLPPLCKLFLYARLESVSTKIYCQYMRFIDAGTTTRALVNMRRNSPANFTPLRLKFHGPGERMPRRVELFVVFARHRFGRFCI